MQTHGLLMLLHCLVAELTGRKDAHRLQCKISERFHQQCYKKEAFDIRQVEVGNSGSSTSDFKPIWALP